MAGLRPGFGRGGITHSLEVTESVVDDKGDGAVDIGFIERGGGRDAMAGASVTGEGAIDGVELLDVEVMAIGGIQAGWKLGQRWQKILLSE